MAQHKTITLTQEQWEEVRSGLWIGAYSVGQSAREAEQHGWANTATSKAKARQLWQAYLAFINELEGDTQ